VNLRPNLSTDKSEFLIENIVGYLVGSKNIKVSAGSSPSTRRDTYSRDNMRDPKET
jgi:hypothetical protein